MTIEHQYLELLADVLANGEMRDDRTGIGTYSVFGRQLRHDFADGFPMLTTKRVAWKAMVGELLWFIEGSSDNNRLSELTHKGDPNQPTIWSLNALSPYWKPKAKFQGDLGRIYGKQWREWNKYSIERFASDSESPDGSVTTYYDAKVRVEKIDQLARIIETIKTNPTDRRMILTAFNVGELDAMALPPCHMTAQFYVGVEQKTLSCQVYIRSNDLFLGLPFNIASYALLTEMIAHVTGLTPKELIITIGDAHIYKTHIEEVAEQISRTPLNFPTVKLDPEVQDIDGFSFENIHLINYQHCGVLKAPMAV
jgi:thymidylate synthase